MKLKWEKDATFDDTDYNLLVRVDDEWKMLGYIEPVGSWWEVCAYWAYGQEAPSGARFESLHAAKIYMRKHAMVAIVGGYKP